MSELALQLIAEAKRTNAKVLDLGDCGLTELPNELFGLTELEELNLCNDNLYIGQNKVKANCLKNIGQAINKLKLLKVLRIAGSIFNNFQISDISSLAGLTRLQILDLSNNQISDISSLACLTGLQILDLSNNQISDISSLSSLIELKRLDLVSNKISDASLINLPKLESLNLCNNEVKGIFLNNLSALQTLELPKSTISNISLINTTSLQSFELYSDQISNFSLSNLTNLVTINLRSKKISNISFTKLTNIETLDLSNKQISSVSLTNLTKLKTLDLSDNQISDISLTNLTKLKALDLNNNQISDISLTNLMNLKEINFKHNELSKLSFLKNLTALKVLDISNNRISDISFFKNSANLIILNLNYNHIKNISSISSLKNLKELYVDSNLISDISFLSSLKNLRMLNLSHNPILDISSIEYLTKLNALDLRAIPISDISILGKLPELKELYLYFNNIKGLDTKHLKNYIKDLKEFLSRQAELVKLEVKYPVKVMLFGNHASGKSTFTNFFVNNQLQSEDSTHILRIVNYPPKQKDKLPEAVFFDFGGQDYYHGLYRIYLSNQAINLIFWREKHNHNEIVEQDNNGLSIYNFNLNYWLAQKTYFEKNIVLPDKAFVVKTHIDENNEVKVPETIYDYEKDFECCLELESEDHINRNFLRNTLKKEIETLRKHNSTEEPQWYINFLAFLYNHKPDNPFEPLPFEYILENHYDRTTKTALQKIEFLKVNLKQLHNSGIILFYDNQQLRYGEGLKPLSKYGLVWTNPSGLVEKLHQEIFNRDKLLKSKNPGIITLEELGLDPIKDLVILKLLKLQKVIFHHSKEDKYIIPNFLRLSSEFDGHYHILKKKLKHSFTLQFKHFIPFGLINELMCYYSENINEYCRNGIIFEIGRHIASIELTMEKLQVNVSYLLEDVTEKQDLDRYFFMAILAFYVNNLPIGFHDFMMLKENYRKKYFSLIQSNEPNLDRSYTDPENVHMAYLTAIGKTKIFSAKNSRYPKDLLISIDKTEFVLNSDLNIKGNEILAYDENGNSLNKNISKTAFNSFMENPITDTKKVFISYSHKDIEYRERLQIQLKQLVRQKRIEKIWSDHKIKAGDNWNAEIENNLKEADIVFLLISDFFLASDYIYEKELPIVKELYENNECKVIPILVKPSGNWKDSGWSFLQAIPSNPKDGLLAISKWDDKDEAWSVVTDEIKQVLK